MKILTKHKTRVQTLWDLLHFSSQVPSNWQVNSWGKEGCSRNAGEVRPDFSAARPAGGIHVLGPIAVGC